MTNDDLSESLRWGPVPMDAGWCGADNLHKVLMDSAMYHTSIALSNFTKESTDMAVAALHAGIAIELLAKCYLCTVDPVLIAPRGCDLDTLLHLAGKSDLAKTPPHAIQTVGGVEACQRAKRLSAEFRFHDADALLFTVRNSVSHLGVTYGTRQVIRIMVRLADSLLVAIGCTRKWFWGNQLTTVDTLRDETISEQLAVLRVKYDKARRYLEASTEGLSSAEVAAFKLLGAARLRNNGVDYEQEYTCPVCESPGALLCHREYDFIDGGSIDNSYRIFNEPVAYPFEFLCGVCNLQLDGSDMEAADIPNQIELPDSEIGKIARP